MKLKNFLPALACGFALTFCVAASASAATINVTYSLTGSGAGDPLNPPLLGNATGTVSPFGNVVWTDSVFPDLSTGIGTGTFKMTFGGGNSLFGTLVYVGDFSKYPLVPFTQTLNVTGGTGAYLLYHGLLTGLELSDQTTGAFTSSGSGTLVTTPEPGSLALFGTGLMCLYVYRKKVVLFQ